MARSPANKRSLGGAGWAGLGGVLLLLAVAVIALTDSAGPADAASVTMTTTKDNTLYEDAAGAKSNGAGSYFFTGNTKDGFHRRAVIAFDLSAVPAGSTITGVTLTLRASRVAQNVGETVSLRRLLANWGEGTSNADQQEGAGAASTPGDATWIHTFYNTAFWSTAGGDFSSAASAATTVGGTGQYSWSSAGMVADVQAWLDNPATNFGWIVMGNEGTAETAKRFDSKENTTVANRPSLTITYTPPTTATPTPT